jgi:hypothetical protein
MLLLLLLLLEEGLLMSGHCGCSRRRSWMTEQGHGQSFGRIVLLQ